MHIVHACSWYQVGKSPGEAFHGLQEQAAAWHGARALPGTGWHCTGLGAPAAQDGGRLPAEMWELGQPGVVAGHPQGHGCCQSKPSLDFQQGPSKTAAWQWRQQKCQPWDVQGRSGERERPWGGSRALEGTELEDSQEESWAGACASRALRDSGFIHILVSAKSLIW